MDLRRPRSSETLKSYQIAAGQDIDIGHNGFATRLAGASHAFLPAKERHNGPNALDKPERPGALQETIDRAQSAGAGKSQHEPAAAALQRVTDKHQRHREKPEQLKPIHQRNNSHNALQSVSSGRMNTKPQTR